MTEIFDKLKSIIKNCATTQEQLLSLIATNQDVSSAYRKLISLTYDLQTELNQIKLFEQSLHQIPEVVPVKVKIHDEIHKLMMLLVEQRRDLNLTSEHLKQIALAIESLERLIIDELEVCAKQYVMSHTELTQNIPNCVKKKSLLNREIAFFEGEPRMQMPLLRTGLSASQVNSLLQSGRSYESILKEYRSGFAPASMAQILATRVDVYYRLKNKGLTIEQIKKDPLYWKWWENGFTTGDAIEYSLSEFRIILGENAVWQCNKQNSGDSMTLPKMDEKGDEVKGDEVNRGNYYRKMNSDYAKTNKVWLKLIGDCDLLKEYVDAAFALNSEEKMQVYFPGDADKNPRGSLWWVGSLGYYNSNASGRFLNNTNDSRLVGVKW